MTKDGGPAFPTPQGHNGLTAHEEHTDNHFELGMSLRDWFAGRGAACLPYAADDELWSYFRNNADSTLAALRDYDAYMTNRAFRYADALLAEREKTED